MSGPFKKIFNLTLESAIIKIDWNSGKRFVFNIIFIARREEKNLHLQPRNLP